MKKKEYREIGKIGKITAAFLCIAMVMAGCGGNAESGVGSSVGSGSSAGNSGEGSGENSSGDSVGSGAENSSESNTENNSGDSMTADTANVTVLSVYESVGKAVELPVMIEGDDDYISNYYGINPEDLEEYIFAEAEDAALASAVIIMKAKSEDSVTKITDSLNTVLAQKAAEMQDYIPEQYDIVADSLVRTEGLYVYLVISENAGDIESVIQSALK